MYTQGGARARPAPSDGGAGAGFMGRASGLPVPPGVSNVGTVHAPTFSRPLTVETLAQKFRFPFSRALNKLPACGI
ncbi:MAG: hypothetical protein O3C10_14135 [Chloroflexi bacterium]|nr:hypothetical protein [Chloroflexota bacterium]